jgi:DNA primase catalytic core
MARIPESEIERIKQEVAIERLVEASGVQLKRAGKDLFGRCPFHAPDDTPSLSVTPAKNLWNCLGACQDGGDVFKWVMKMRGVSFRHAYELLNTDPALAAASRPVKQGTVRALPAPVAPDAEGQTLKNQTMDFYQARLKHSPAGLGYLEKRGIRSEELIEHFKLGFADRTLGLRLPEKNRLAGSQMRERLQAIGILLPSGHERFNGSLVIPVCDERGNVTEIYGRKVNDNLRAGTPTHLYLPAECRGPVRGVWNVQALASHKEIILTEALIDALTFVAAGFPNVTSAYGTSGFTDEHLAAFQRYGTQRVLIAYDRDAAGDKAAAELAPRLISEGIECFRILFPKGMDANEYALKVQPAAKSLGIAIRKAVWLGKGTAPKLHTVAPAIEAASAIEEEPHAFARAPAASSLVAELAAKEKTPEANTAALRARAAQLAPIAPPLPASPMPAAPSLEPVLEIRVHEILATCGEGGDARRYRVRGFAKNLSFEVLRVNLLAAQGEAFYVDTFDLYNAKARAGFIAQAAAELGVSESIVKRDLGAVRLALEKLQDEAIRKSQEPEEPVHPDMTEPEREAAMQLLRDRRLIERIPEDLTACGLVGEPINKLVGVLAVVSRKLERPLGVVIQSSSAAGKSSLMDALLEFVPQEERVKYSAMTGQALFYMGDVDLKHKALAIVEEEGAARASYALKLLQSEGELTIASTGKDPETGNLIAQPYRVEGPVALLVTTTARDLNEELLNRCLVLAVDESREQTKAIHARQREARTLEGLIAKREREALRRLHQNAQRLLKALDVLNPYARWLTFPDQTTRLRRDHEKYLTLIDTIALLHQHQRPVKTTTRGDERIEYVEVTLDDIALANTIAHEVLGRSLDELPPQTRRLLRLIDRFVAAECKRQHVKRADFRFSRRRLREALAWGDTQLKIHLARLVEFEYLAAHRGSQASLAYELVYDAPEGEEVLRFPGLADIEALKHAYDAARSGGNAERSAPGRPPVGARSGGGRGGENAATPREESDSADSSAKPAKTHIQGSNGTEPSYPQPAVAVAAKARRR